MRMSATSRRVLGSVLSLVGIAGMSLTSNWEAAPGQGVVPTMISIWSMLFAAVGFGLLFPRVLLRIFQAFLWLLQ